MMKHQGVLVSLLVMAVVACGQATQRTIDYSTTIEDGESYDLLTITGRNTVVTMNGGTVHVDCEVQNGAELIMNGGSIFTLNCWQGSRITLRGGGVGMCTIFSGSDGVVNGASVGMLSVFDWSSVEVDSGKVWTLSAYNDASVFIYGGEFPSSFSPWRVQLEGSPRLEIYGSSLSDVDISYGTNDRPVDSSGARIHVYGKDLQYSPFGGGPGGFEGFVKGKWCDNQSFYLSINDPRSDEKVVLHECDDSDSNNPPAQSHAARYGTIESATIGKNMCLVRGKMPEALGDNAVKVEIGSFSQIIAAQDAARRRLGNLSLYQGKAPGVALGLFDDRKKTFMLMTKGQLLSGSAAPTTIGVAFAPEF